MCYQRLRTVNPAHVGMLAYHMTNDQFAPLSTLTFCLDEDGELVLVDAQHRPRSRPGSQLDRKVVRTLPQNTAIYAHGKPTRSWIHPRRNVVLQSSAKLWAWIPSPTDWRKG